MQLALVVCYIPVVIQSVINTNEMRGMNTDISGISDRTTTTITYLNSSLNPILYCRKMKEVRQAMKDTIKQLP